MNVTRLPANTAGRDMVVGDIHGHIEDLAVLLKQADFNEEKDRLFSTGDIVDRGPDSMRCLALNKRRWFHVVAGNHELMLAVHIKELIEMGETVVRQSARAIEKHLDDSGMGGGWLASSFLRTPSETQWRNVIKLIDSMPNLIIVGEGVGRFHIVHGGLFIGQAVVDDAIIDQLENDIKCGALSAPVIESVRDGITWHRAIAQLVQDKWQYDATHEGLSITYCGHNIVAEPTMALSHYHIDTGSGLQGRFGRREYGLTLAVLENGFPVKTFTTKGRN